MTMEERLTAVERRLDQLRVPPVRDELTNLRDVHGARLAAIEIRLGDIERNLSENESWIARRFDDIESLIQGQS